MALKELPHDVRSILCASAQINNNKTAVAELVYNSLDAESTSIAIRVHLQENRIQVIDNGYGITKNDFDALGQRYMTSKITDLSTLKSMPKCYGFKGEFLASIIEISHNVKIISRHKDGEETWAKTFLKGKKKQFAKMATRPSKGTTVEVKGFLYNLKIQKQGIDPVNDLQSIKTFLEQLSIAHNNISLSLRDDSKNEIVFKIHKKRDVYQTLSILFNIDRSMVQELQVEKNQYKVKAFIGKTDTGVGKQWIHLNGRFLQSNTKLHKIINENLKRYLLIKYKNISKSKNDHGEDDLFKQNLPFYFVFVSCPYIDYHITFTLRQPIVEFKNWNQIKKMFEKLVKFYIGDINLKENKKTESKDKLKHLQDKGNKDADDKIKNIITKILGSNSKGLGVSQLQNGVKGKLINRKNRKNKDAKKQKHIFGKDRSIYNQIKFVKSTRDCTTDIKQKSVSLRDISIPTNNQDKPTRGPNGLQDCNTDSGHTKKKRTSYNFHSNKYSPVTRKNKHIPKASEENPKERNYINLNNNVTTSNNKMKKQKKSNIIRKTKVIKNHNCQIETKRNGKHRNNTKLNADPIQPKLVVQKEENYYRCPNNDRLLEKKDASNMNLIDMFANNHYYTNCVKYNVPLQQKTDKYNVENYLKHKIKMNPFKTTYDLVQTILESQQERRLYQANYSSQVYFKDCPIIGRRLQILPKTKISSPIKTSSSKNEYISEFTNFTSKQGHETLYHTISRDQASCELTNITGIQCTDMDYRYNKTLDNTELMKMSQQSLRCEDIFKENSDKLCTQNIPSHYSSNIPTESRLTYESHKHNDYDIGYIKKLNANNDMARYSNKIHSMRFITKQSRDNFTTHEKYKSLYSNHFKHKNEKQTRKRTTYYSQHIKQREDESYRIKFTKSSKINCSIKYRETLVTNHSNYSRCNKNDNAQSIYKIHPPNKLTLGFSNTYTIPTYSISSDCRTYYIQSQAKCTDSNELFMSNSIYYSKAAKKNCYLANETTKHDSNQEQDEISVVFVSKSQTTENERLFDNNVQPMEVCETVLSTNETNEDQFYVHCNSDNRLDDSLYNNFHNIRNNKDKYYTQIIKGHNNNEEVSHHFSNTLTTKDLKIIDEIEANLQTTVFDINLEENNNVEQNTLILQNDKVECNENIEDVFNKNHNYFNFKNRLRFLPKGMSQIFEKCGSKTICDYNLDKDYYEDIIYNDFANDVQMQAEIYEPVIKNYEDFTTKDIHKFENKVHKDNTSLVFDKGSLKEAKVLNQVDCKFIVAIIEEKVKDFKKSSEYLVLFDQHAVHERIRLERNLTDYFSENRWKSVPLDNITLKITKDEMLYLHNFKDKFTQLGLQWSILNNDEISLSSIPEAILGKNPREVDKVIKAVKNLITEQIGVIKLQKGCISLYPKPIMDLVFNEACRYAIKFGDKLSKNECIDLLNDLSKCKIPFQCAHGRPVMAVLVDIKSNLRDYKIETSSLSRFKLNKKTINV